MLFSTTAVLSFLSLVSALPRKASRKLNGKGGKGGKGGKKDDSMFSLRIVHLNDHHSHVEPEGFDIEPDDGYPVSLQGYEEIEVEVGGWPLLVPAIAAAVEEAEDMDMPVLKLHAGDAITGTQYYTAYAGEADAAFMNAVCFDAFALGNHEFDDGDSGLSDFLDFLNDNNNDCHTSVVAANVVPGPDSPIDGKIEKNAVFKYKGHKVGVIGIDVRQKTLISSSPDEGTDLLDEETVAREQVDMLTEDGVDIIVLLTHVGVDTDLSTMAKIPGVDIVVGGDSHTFMGFTPPVPVEQTTFDYPEIVMKDDGTITCVAHAYQYSTLMGVLDASFDDDGNIVSCSGNPVVPYGVVNSGLTDKEASDLVKYLDGTFWKNTMADMVATSALDFLGGEINELFGAVIGDIAADICYERIPGQGRSQICDCTETDTQGGGVCNIVAQSFVAITPTADIALQNAGGCRTDLPAGDFTIGDAYRLLPFSNTIVTMEATGAQIIDLLQEGLTNTQTSTGAYPYAYGIRYDVDLPSFTVSNVEVNPRVEGTWEAIDMAATYTVVTNSFLARGGDGYFTAETLDKTDTFKEYAQAFVDFVEDVGSVMDLPLDVYSTKSITGGRTCSA